MAERKIVIDWYGGAFDVIHEKRDGVETIRYGVGAAAERIKALEAKNAKLKDTLSFFTSVIQSGERWSEQCREAYDAALKDGE